MAEHNTKETVAEKGQADATEKGTYEIEYCAAMTGGLHYERYLYYQLKTGIARARRIDIVVSFLMESGVRMLLDDMKAAMDKGVKVRILTGNYLGITQPSALYLIKSQLGESVDLRFYNDKSRSFHPKAYIFHKDTESEIFIGSSNLSKSALTSGIEWNYRFSDKTDEKNYQLFYETFKDLFYNHTIVIDDVELKRYSQNWRKPAVQKDLEKHQEETASDERSGDSLHFYPQGVQIEALYALSKSREEGARKALIHAATGVGKTYLAAFDSKDYKRVLFVAHRQEILRQAEESFKNVREEDDFGYFDGDNKETSRSVIFASVASLGKSCYLNEQYFSADYFDYIVIDEFHHAVSVQYRRIISYFKPCFLLGLTATPERMDGKDIYEICDYNVPYEISLQTAINKGVLAPFRYYGIYDKTDYSKLRMVKGRYEKKELERIYAENADRYDLIERHYKKYGAKRALGFCCSRTHAEEMAKAFCSRGIPSLAVYSDSRGQFSEDRQIAIEKLEKGDIKVIFSVDMFNEGIDIPSVDMVMFLRPTESPVVFLQQLGRGLRKAKGKMYLTVLDFIGNYEKAGNAPFLLSGQVYSGQLAAKTPAQKFQFPDDCIVDFDLRLIDLFQEMAKRNLKVKDQIVNEFYRVKALVDGKVPNRMELFTWMEDEIYQLCKKNSKENPFRKYLAFLHDIGELSSEEESLYTGIGGKFLNMLEKTDMQKSYKIPILMAFYNGGKIKMAVTEEDILFSWKAFYNTGTNWKDITGAESLADYHAISDTAHLGNAKRNPIHFLLASGNGFFVEKKGFALAMKEELREVVLTEAFRCHLKDIIDYKATGYYRSKYESHN